MPRELLFSVTLKDCRVDTFRAGGKGGQNQNKVESGVRITHLASGAVGEARDSRDQLRNKLSAFERMAKTPKFREWHRIRLNEILTHKTVDQIVDEQMESQHLKIETKDENDRWVVASLM